MAKIRVNHFASKTINTGNPVDWETMLIEIMVASLLGVFAYMGYQAKIPLLFFPCAILSVVVLIAFFHAVFLSIKNKRSVKKE